MRRGLAPILAAGLLVGAGCSGEQGTGDKGYVSLDGNLLTVAPADRGAPIAYDGVDLEGQPLDLADLRGKPTVVMVWGAWCGPCRKEAPELSTIARQYADRVNFVGLNVRDPTTARPLALARSAEMPYRSWHEPEGRALLAFRGTLTPSSVPAIVLLDSEGRAAAAILGPYPSVRTVTSLIDDALAEAGGTGG